jgi:hypothetical protein
VRQGVQQSPIPTKLSLLWCGQLQALLDVIQSWQVEHGATSLAEQAIRLIDQQFIHQPGSHQTASQCRAAFNLQLIDLQTGQQAHGLYQVHSR